VYSPNDAVKHPKFGTGRVILDDGQTVVAQFEHGIERCLSPELERLDTPLEAARREVWDSPLEVITRAQAEAIQSVNDGWGVLSRSRIALLPHQLWVCRRVLESWPARWLVADDVGLGKTIEAGLVLWPLLARGTVRRLLILCPASLVEQWQDRLRTMFDIRLARYVTEADTAKSDFWYTHPQVVASLQTLRKDSGERHGRMLEAPPWDLLVVDEAHHLNADEETGPTLGYRLVERLAESGKLSSMVFFTGTPHRGKDHGFLALLKLLRPETFDPRKPLGPQLPELRRVMIRNNKQNVTDLKGNRLFHTPSVNPETYAYSPEEARFYDMLTDCAPGNVCSR
jgi:SNF2 family DNA or RNA helicase